jgi:hypothetical protein
VVQGLLRLFGVFVEGRIQEALLVGRMTIRVEGDHGTEE